MAYTAQPVGQLDSLVEFTLRWANEPRISAKFADYKLYPLLKANYKEVVNEVIRLADNPVLARFNISVVTNVTTRVILPTNVGTIYRICERDATTDVVKTEYWNYSKKYPAGPLFQYEGNSIRFIPVWGGKTTTLTVEYIPNGSGELAKGSVNPSGANMASLNTLVISTTPDSGYFDRNPNAFLGMRIRLLTGSHNPSGYTFWPTQDRIITGYNPTYTAGPQLTVSPDFDFNPNTVASITSVTYEIVPDGLDQLTPLLSLKTAVTLHRLEGNLKRAEELHKEYLSKMRDVRLTVSSLDGIRGNRFEHETAISLWDLWNSV